MLASLMDDKRLDFDAPLLSVRRFSAGPPPATAAADCGNDSTNPPVPRPSPPFYKPDIKSGPVRNPGVVPFIWEQRPGKPKDEPESDLPRRMPAPPKPPPRLAAPGAKLGSSVRTRKPFQTFSDLIVARSPEKSEGGESGMKAIEEIKDDDPAPQSLVRALDGWENQAAEATAVATGPAEQEGAAAAAEEAFLDALDTLSRAESYSVNCSVSGLPEPAEPPGGLSADSKVRDFMMGRFLPAAQAVASESPQYNFRKTAAPKLAETVGMGDHRRPLFPRPYLHRPSYVRHYPRLPEYEEKEEEDEDEDYEDVRHLALKGCGLLPKFCVKGSFCLLNPVPGMKPRDQAALSRGWKTGNPMIRSSQGGSLGQAEEEHSWEAIYRHKLGQRYQPQREDGSKLDSESNHLTCWSDTQTADGSLPFHHSTGGGASPYQSEPAESPFHEVKLSIGMAEREKDGKTDASDSSGRDGKNSVIASTHSSQQVSGTTSPALDRTLFFDCANQPDTLDLEAVAENRVAIMSVVQNSEHGGERLEIRGGFIVENCVSNGMDHELSKVVEPGLRICTERSENVEIYDDKNWKTDVTEDQHLIMGEADVVKKYVKLVPSVLPLPSPKSPSESWLSRTLPSVSSRNPPMQSFLGIQFQSKKQSSQAPTDAKKGVNVKSPGTRRTRFAEVLEIMPACS